MKTLDSVIRTLMAHNLLKHSKHDSYERCVTTVSTNDSLQFLNLHVHEVVDKTSQRKLFICSLCGKTHAQKVHCRNHLEAIHFPNRFNYVCPHCGKTYNCKNKMYVHESYHRANKCF